MAIFLALHGAASLSGGFFTIGQSLRLRFRREKMPTKNPTGAASKANARIPKDVGGYVRLIIPRLEGTKYADPVSEKSKERAANDCLASLT
jgi:hypothetical protein